MSLAASSMPAVRWDSGDVIELFRKSIEDIFPPAKTELLSPDVTKRILRRHRRADRQVPEVLWDQSICSIVAFLHASGRVEGELTPSRVGYGIRVEVSSAHDLKSELHFVCCFVRLFNEDLVRCSTMEDRDAWDALCETRFPRAIADMSPFDRRGAFDWIQAMEQSMSLTYEGRSVRHSVLCVHDSNLIMRRIGRYVARLDSPLTMKSALLDEKWVRAVVDGDRVILLSDAAGKIVGLVSFSSMVRDGRARGAESLYAPHTSLSPLQHMMRKNDMAFIVSEHGDLYVQFWDGIVFKKSQARWRYQNYMSVHRCMCGFLEENVVLSVLRAVLDLSFEREGALIFIRPKRNLHGWEPIADFHDQSRANGVLRNALRGMRITKWADRQVITSAASTDGATVLDEDGRVVDVACMIAPPPEDVLRAHGFEQHKSFDGARAKAAWHASFAGTAIKVSEDGPITIWQKGKCIAQID
jgi:DNA integrity scanning protein DisA with diadenylate cyclase activity